MVTVIVLVVVNVNADISTNATSTIFTNTTSIISTSNTATYTTIAIIVTTISTDNTRIDEQLDLLLVLQLLLL